MFFHHSLQNSKFWGRFPSHFHPICPIFGQFWPELADFGQFFKLILDEFGHLDRNWIFFNHFLPNSKFWGQFPSDFNQIWPIVLLISTRFNRFGAVFFFEPFGVDYWWIWREMEYFSIIFYKILNLEANFQPIWSIMPEKTSNFNEIQSKRSWFQKSGNPVPRVRLLGGGGGGNWQLTLARKKRR